MYVSGLRSARRRPSTRTSARWPLNFALNVPPCRRASSSTTMNPTLCRSRSCRRPGLPSPTTSRSSVEAPRPDGRAARATPRRRQRRRPRRRTPQTPRPFPRALVASSAASSASSRRGRAGASRSRSTVSAGSSRNVTPLTGGTSWSRRMSPSSELAEVDLDVLGDVRRKRLDVELARDLLHDAADLRPRRLADEMHEDGRLDRLVEPHLVEVDVRDRAADRMLLVVLEHRVMRRLLALDDDVDDPVQAGGAGQRDSQLPLADDERLVRLPVEHARDQPLTTQALRRCGVPS